ncbi:hypothetical protein EDE12_11039 [Methylosinus sp. sav-2]|uniref:radical SAM protein n=1 Tax=Methylosinus sp. sav-2 TaxID=2485168 RepID=UPI0010E58EB3|nr:radical SAM protein [Methylosinus sp. sav-2]TDX62523.1 hypothetical protein EDE12_11039 [Methylosinus sp. sav-2]
MPREIIVTGIHLHANATACFHHCRYCQLKSYRLRPAPLERFVALVERFIEWRNDGHEDFEIAPWYGNSHDYTLATTKALRELEKNLGWKSHVVLLGGVAHRPRREMKQWLVERRVLGIDTVVATFSGHGARHDHWNNMAGNYQFQLDTLHLAAELGLKLQQRILLIRDSVPSLDELLVDLDRIPAASHERWAIPLFYSGVARGVEEQRLTEQEIDSLPARLKDYLRDDRPNWRSEKSGSSMFAGRPMTKRKPWPSASRSMSKVSIGPRPVPAIKSSRSSKLAGVRPILPRRLARSYARVMAPSPMIGCILMCSRWRRLGSIVIRRTMFVGSISAPQNFREFRGSIAARAGRRWGCEAAEHLELAASVGPSPDERVLEWLVTSLISSSSRLGGAHTSGGGARFKLSFPQPG